jgi:hypothetical protein
MKTNHMKTSSNFFLLAKKCQNFCSIYGFKFMVTLLLFAMLVGSAAACGGSRGSGRQSKTIKKGKPIPCPQKDC